MLDLDLRVAEELERVVPRYEGESGNWEAVAAAARRRPFPRPALALPAAAALVLVLLWPFGGGSGGGVLERALAAAGHGPVVHAVFREFTGGTTEAWYLPPRGLALSEGGSGPRTLHAPGTIRPDDGKVFAALLLVTGLGETYRDALASGRARSLGEGIVDGVPVHWIFAGAVWTRPGDRVSVRELEVAVSQKTYAPVAVRTTRDGEPWAPGTVRILRFETLPAAAFPTAR